VGLGVADPQVPAVVRDVAVDVLLAARVDEVGGLAAHHLDHAGAQVADVDAGLLVDADGLRMTLSWSLPTWGSPVIGVEDLGLDEGEEHGGEAAHQELVAGVEVLALLDRGAGGQAGLPSSSRVMGEMMRR
jgi:hypothetical protein